MKFSQNKQNKHANIQKGTICFGEISACISVGIYIYIYTASTNCVIMARRRRWSNNEQFVRHGHPRRWRGQFVRHGHPRRWRGQPSRPNLVTNCTILQPWVKLAMKSSTLLNTKQCWIMLKTHLRKVALA